VGKIVETCEELSLKKGEEALNLMQQFYDGYCFSERSNEQIYNPTLVLYFLKHFQQYCIFPRMMLDDNLAMDRGKLGYISGLMTGKYVIFQALNATPPLSLFELANRFSLDDMLKMTHDNGFRSYALTNYFFYFLLGVQSFSFGTGKSSQS